MPRTTKKALRIQIQLEAAEASLPSFLASIESATKEFTALTTGRHRRSAVARNIRHYSKKLMGAMDEIAGLESKLKYC
jgi:hypothetical protein